MKNLQLELVTGHAQAKACTKCGEVKPLSEFYQDKTRKGYLLRCKLCLKTYQVEYHKANREKIAERYEANREKILKKKAEYKKANRERIRKRDAEYHKANREKILKKASEYRKANPEYAAEYHKANREKISTRKAEYKKANRKKINAEKAKRRATKIKATPPWLNKAHLIEIEGMYSYHQIFSAVMPDKAWHVDHIVPLQGRKAKGLHVPWNLQVIPASENASKQNKLPPVSEQTAYQKKFALRYCISMTPMQILPGQPSSLSGLR